MRLLLDTHVLIWSVSAPEQLSDELQAIIRDPGNDLFVSLVSLWEVIIKLRVGKLRLRLEELDRTMDQQDITRLPLMHHHLAQVEGLPMHHGDPFDHLLIAQAICEDLILVTRDREMAAYPVRLMPC